MCIVYIIYHISIGVVVKLCVTNHPQYGARQLFKLVRAAPAGLHCSQAKVTNLHRQILVEENI